MRNFPLGPAILLVLAVTCSVALPAQTRPGDTTWLGVQMGRQSAATLEGVPILRVIEGSPAARAGLRARDRIVAVNGQPVQNNGELIRAIRDNDPGSWVPLTVDRGGDELDVRVRLSVRPSDGSGMRPRTGWIGVQAIALPPTLREHFGTPRDAGVMISEVLPGSPAESAGLRLGDVVFELEGEPVKSPGDLLRLIGGAGVGNRAEFRLTRWGNELFVEASIEIAPAGKSRS